MCALSAIRFNGADILMRRWIGCEFQTTSGASFCREYAAPQVVMGHKPIQQVVVRQLKPTVAEQKLLELLLASEELRKIVLPRLEPSDYDGIATAPIFRALVKLNEDEGEVNFDSLSAETPDDPCDGRVVGAFDDCRAN